MKQKRSHIGKVLRRLDLFGERISFRANGSDYISSYFGALISLLSMCFVFFYAFGKFNVMLERQDNM